MARPLEFVVAPELVRWGYAACDKAVRRWYLPDAPAATSWPMPGGIGGRQAGRDGPRGSFALELAGGAGGRALGAILQPFGDFREWRHVDPGRAGPGEDAGDVEIGDGEIGAEQVGGAAEHTVEHAERLRERFLGGVRCGEIAVALGIDRTVHHRGQHRALDLGHAPEAPLPGPRLILDPARIEPARAVFLGEIEVDRHRLPQDEAVIVDDRNMPVGIQRKVRWRARLAGREIDLDVLIVEPEFLRHPQDTRCPRAGDTVDFERHDCLYLKSRPVASPARKMFGFKNIDSTSAPSGERAMWRLPLGRHT